MLFYNDSEFINSIDNIENFDILLNTGIKPAQVNLETTHTVSLTYDLHNFTIHGEDFDTVIVDIILFNHNQFQNLNAPLSDFLDYANTITFMNKNSHEKYTYFIMKYPTVNIDDEPYLAKIKKNTAIYMSMKNIYHEFIKNHPVYNTYLFYYSSKRNKASYRHIFTFKTDKEYCLSIEHHIQPDNNPLPLTRRSDTLTDSEISITLSNINDFIFNKTHIKRNNNE